MKSCYIGFKGFGQSTGAFEIHLLIAMNFYMLKFWWLVGACMGKVRVYPLLEREEGKGL